jgi:hypothetical protein
MPDLYQPKYEHLLMDAQQAGLNPAKLEELRQAIVLAGDSATTHQYPVGTILSNAQTGNLTTTILKSVGKMFTNDILLRIVSTIGATPTAKFDIKVSPAVTAFANINYALIATPNTFVATQITITTAATNIYRIPAAALLAVQANQLEVVVTLNTNVTFTIDAWNFDGVPV